MRKCSGARTGVICLVRAAHHPSNFKAKDMRRRSINAVMIMDVRMGLYHNGVTFTPPMYAGG